MNIMINVELSPEGMHSVNIYQFLLVNYYSFHIN